MSHEIIEEDKFQYLETNGSKENLLLLHGLFGALSNFQGIIDHFSDKYNVVVPLLPILELPIRKVSVSALVVVMYMILSHLRDMIKYIS